MSLADAELLRSRAIRLRAFGAFLRSCDAASLYLRSDLNTWAGPTPQHCFDELTTFRADLRRMHDDLVNMAIRLERDAETAAAAALVPATR